MSYSVKEIFFTLQGEGANTGSPAVFCRFAGCNLWSGKEADRSTAQCRFCDTDFVGTDGSNGGRYDSVATLTEQIERLWPSVHWAHRFVVLTGGEPLLQTDGALIKELHGRGFRVAVETNGTISPPAGIDWVCVSPKNGGKLVVLKGQELKVVWPQYGLNLRDLDELDFEHFFLQPMDGPQRAGNTKSCIEACMSNPRWRLSLQIHKVVGIR